MKADSIDLDAEAAPAVGGRGYRAAVLALLFTINVLNFADRSILSVLADLIKKDLHLTDAQLGLLVGTVFVVLNSVVGLIVGGMTDNWLRNRLLASGVGIWSGMTALSGLATGFAQLAFARIGVGLGEAVAGPVAHSLIGDIFPVRLRARAFAIYFCAPSVGMGLCLALSGWIVQIWPQRCGALGLCAVPGWHIPFFLFGLPGLLVAVIAWFLRDPAQGAVARARDKTRPWALLMRELAMLIPPFSFIALARIGGARAVVANLLIAAAIAVVAFALIALTGDTVQWVSVGVTFYAFGSSCHALAYREPRLFALTMKSRAFVTALLGAALVGTCSGAIGFWSVPLAIREIGMDHAAAGSMLGAAIGIGSISGTLLGGLLADRWCHTNPAAPLIIAMLSMVASAITLGVMLLVHTPIAYTLVLTLFMVATTAWAPPIAALVQELVLPDMRGRAAAIYTVGLTMIGMSAGPYAVGKVADLTGSLRLGMLVPLAPLPLCLALLALSIRYLPDALRAREALAAADRS